tara:strand:+ start:191 stop:349 length:159 start_codon:yes stop_codon:yes gene_type:complete
MGNGIVAITAAISAGAVSVFISSSDIHGLTFDDEDPFGIGVKEHCPQRQKIQ